MNDDTNDADTIARRRAELAAFLRKRRRALVPSDVGLTSAGRRHVRGLRREEVAALAGIGVSWYTLLEQGVVRNVSGRTLDAIATALRLDALEREHLIALAGSAPVAPGAPPSPLRAFVEAVPGGPAFLLDPRCDVVAWNEPAEALFAFGTRPASERNLIRAMFLDRTMRDIFVTWDQAARDMVGTLRANFARSGDASFVAFVDGLRAESAAFARTWDERDVRSVPTHESCIVRIDGRQVEVHLNAFDALDAPGHTLVVLTPFALAPAKT